MNRKGWTYKKLREVCDLITDGSHNPPKGVEHSSYRMISSQNVFDDMLVADDSNIRFLSEEDYERENKRTRLSENVVLLTIVGAIGRSCVLKESDKYLTLQRSVAALHPSSSIESRYLMHCLIGYRKVLENEAHGAAQKGIYLKQLSSLEIPLPPKDTQVKIVSELDSLKDSITLLQKQLTDLDELAMSIFYDMFGDPLLNPMAWPIKKIGDIGNVERGAGISKKDFVDSGLPCIHYGQLHTSFGPTAYKNITFIPSNLLPKYKIAHTGDVIMAITSEDVEGSCKSTAWLGDFDLVVGSDAAIYHHSINGVYVSYYTMTKAFYIEKEKYAKGFKVTHISAKEIESIPIPIPPMDLQENFAQKVAAIEDSKATFNVQIKELQNLLAARMQYWFD